METNTSNSDVASLLSTEIHEQLVASLEKDEPRIVTQLICDLLTREPEAQVGAEALLREGLAAPEEEIRLKAAAGFQGIPLVWEEQNNDRANAGAQSIEALLAALAVEQDVATRIELLWALARQNFATTELRDYASVVALIAKRFVEADSAQIDDETTEQLAYLYERLQTTIFEDPNARVRPIKRKLLGYAATGIPFILTDVTEPQVVLVYNENLDAWLPPGGHFNPGMEQTPSETLVNKIKTEAGAESIVYWAALPFEDDSEDVELLPAPSFVLREDLSPLRKSESAEIHSAHYDLNYICQIQEAEVESVGSGTKPTICVRLAHLGADERATIKKRISEAAEEKATESATPELAEAQILPDVVERIRLSLKVLAGVAPEKLYALDLATNGNGDGNGQPVSKAELVEFPLPSVMASGDPG